jgi:uncharacterized repeat protein (TIGR01451 family)
MFAVRFATIRLQNTIIGSRINSSDQFTYQIANTTTVATITGATTSGTGLGPFSTPALNMSAGMPLTLRQIMAAGSGSTLAQYSTTLTCVNTRGPTRPDLPNNLATSNLNIGELQFGESLVCTFTNGGRPRLRLRKVMGSGGRQFTGDQFTIRIREGETVIASRTTTGSGGTVNNGDTGLVQLFSGQPYTLDEIAAGATTILGNYTASISCTNGTSGSTTALPTTVGGTINLRPGDTVTCTVTNTRRSAALLIVTKTSAVVSDPVNGTVNPKLIPGAIVEYVIDVRNVGAGPVNAGTINITDIMPANMAFATGTPVTFANGTTASGLNTFNASTMVSYSSAAGGVPPYTYTPVGPFDANVRGIRIIPTGTMVAATSTTQPSFTIRLRARVQ